MLKNKKLIILIDAHSYIYKFYYAISKKKTYNQYEIINSILQKIKNILIKYTPKTLIFIFDSKVPNFRKKMFKKYKNNRPKIPNDLKNIFQHILKILNYIKIPNLTIDKVEADDVIGTISKIAENHGDQVLIGTNDKDFTQLVNKNIYILNHTKNIILNSQSVQEKYGVPPRLIIDLLSLTGDQSDNIPGVYGIGKKTAVILLKKIGCINKIYNNLFKIKNLSIKNYKNIINKLNQGKKMAFLSYKLSKIKTNVKIKKKYEKLVFNIKNNNLELKYLKYLKIITEIKNIIKKINKFYKKN